MGGLGKKEDNYVSLCRRQKVFAKDGLIVRRNVTRFMSHIEEKI